MARIIDKVKEVCFGVNAESRKGLHRDVLDGLSRVFVKDGYRVWQKYPVCFESRIRKSGDKVSRDGNLDLVAVKNGQPGGLITEPKSAISSGFFPPGNCLMLFLVKSLILCHFC